VQLKVEPQDPLNCRENVTMLEPVLIEVCIDSVASAVAAERGGAQRVELCSDLLEGGVTPSCGLLGVVRSSVSIDVYPIIRPRPGDFCYSEQEFETMCRDIEFARREGADGVVLGILKIDGNVDIERTRQLVEVARPLPVTFHRAFDMSADLFRSLEDVCATGAQRVLTSGGEQECLHGVDTLARLVKASRGRIKLMAGGRIGIHNAATIIERTGVTEIHLGLATAVTSPMFHRNPRLSLGKAPGNEHQRTQVLEESVRKLKNAISVIKTQTTLPQG
jgi:copper homeostasis protein